MRQAVVSLSSAGSGQCAEYEAWIQYRTEPGDTRAEESMALDKPDFLEECELCADGSAAEVQLNLYDFGIQCFPRRKKKGMNLGRRLGYTPRFEGGGPGLDEVGPGGCWLGTAISHAPQDISEKIEVVNCS